MGDFSWQELLNFNEYMKSFIGLFAMADPISTAAVFISISAGFSARERRKMALVSSLSMLTILTIFLFSGMFILNTFGISLGAFTAMGGVVLFLAGLGLMNSDGEVPDSLKSKQNATPLSLAIIPLAIPMLAGPGTLSMLIIFSAEHGGVIEHKMLLLFVCICLAIVSYAVLLSAERISHFFKETGIAIFNKVMGMIVLAIAIEFLFDGVAMHFPDLTTVHQAEYSG